MTPAPAEPAPPPTPPDQRPVAFMRADAARNVHRIVEVAARLLGEDPHAGMAEVAAAAGISRATVYRHFTTREALIDAIRRQALEQAELAFVGCRVEEGSATEALRRLVHAWLDLAERYSFPQLAAQPDLNRSEESREHQRRTFREPLLALIARGQRAGEFSAALSPEWAARAFGALLLAGARAVAEGALSHEDAPGVVFATLLDGLRAGGEER
jgi:TetR/AcrR family transcriptional repressor of mexCD-oprJ operon